jgi:LysR family hydrogen peroxide-inducible transcriptional activator
MLTLKQLSYALSVAEHLHFKRAAEACAVSQSALSSAIQELESQIGFPLFERDNKRVLLTSRGRDFLKRAQSVLMDAQDLMNFAHAQSKPLSHPLSLGVIPTVGPFLLPKVLPLVRERFPKLQLRIKEAQSAQLVQLVRQGELDTAVLALPYPLLGLHAFEFWEEDFYLVVHHDDASLRTLLDAAGGGVKAKALVPEKLLLLEEGHCLKDHALAACRLRISSVGNNALSSTSLYTLIQMVAGRMGSTLVPEMALDQLLTEDSELRAFHLDEPGPHRTLAFITRLNYPGVNSVALLRDCFREALGQSLRASL